jgi:hypothetical protein
LGGKPLTLLLVWGVALLISAGLRGWGAQHPGEPAIDATVVALLVFAPTGLMLTWLLGGLTGGERESDDCEQESR